MLLKLTVSQLLPLDFLAKKLCAYSKGAEYFLDIFHHRLSIEKLAYYED